MTTETKNYYQLDKENILKRQYERKQAKFLKEIEENGWLEGPDYIVCRICGHKGKDLGTHIKTHGMDSKEYKKQYGDDAPIKCQNMCDRIKGANNPGYQHGGKLSVFSDKFVNADPEKKKAALEKAHNTRVENDNYTTSIEYWLKKTNGNLPEAQRLLSERQTTFSLEICIEKYGKKEGTKRWIERQEKWHKNYKKSNFSKISQELFWLIANSLDDLTDIYFAQLDDNKCKDLSGINYEYRLKLDRLCLPDFIDTKKKKIIEFDGVYWHGEVGRGNRLREEEKDAIYINGGYEVLHIHETAFNDNRDEQVKKCLLFLKE